jgi:1,4-alpha-glucan branching enzyme
MKKVTLLFGLLLVSFAVCAQLITTSPSIITKDYSGEVVIIYDATQGNQGLKGYIGDMYAHAGLITQSSSGNNDWKYAPTWGDNSPKYKMTSLGNDKWQLVITPSMKEYYGTSSGDVIEKLAFVFRNADGSKEGKDVGNADIFVDVVNAVLFAQVVTPSNQFNLISKDSTVQIKAQSILSTNLSVYVNENLLLSTTEYSLDTLYKFTTSGKYYVIAEATDGVNSARDSVLVYVESDVVSEPRPLGLEDGITINSTTSASFSIYAPDKERIYLIGDFNDWTPDSGYQLKRDNDYFWRTIDNLEPDKEYAFQYLVDGDIRVGDLYCKKILDPWNDKYISSSVYPNLKPYPTGKTDGTVSVFSTSIEQPYAWEATGFSRPQKEQLFIYELLLRDFTSEGTLNAAIEKLDYLKDLGVNAIELMPINEFDGNDSWGYNPTFYFAPDKAYGTESDYKRFIDECHKREMAVILDVVFNHSWGESPMVKMWWDKSNNRPATNSPYANPVAKHPYNVGYDLNHESTATRLFFKKVLKYWLEEYNVDGFRFDLSKGFTQVNSGNNVDLWGKRDTSRITILKDYHQSIQNVSNTAYTILEHFAENSEERELANEGMLLWGNHNYNFTEAAMGYSSGSNFSGIIAKDRGWQYPNLVGFMESHDEERVGYKTKTYGNWGMIQDSILRAGRASLSAAFMILLPGPKLMWQFGEMDYDYSINYCTNGSIDEGCRTGRKPARWDYLNYEGRKYVHAMYTNILALRNRYPSVFAVQDAPVFTYSISSSLSQIRKVTYTTDSISIVLLGNFGNTAISADVEFPKQGTWYNYLKQEELNVDAATKNITLEPHRFMILLTKNIPLKKEFEEIDIVTGIDKEWLGGEKRNIKVFPNPVKDVLYVDEEVEVSTLKIMNLNGMVVYETAGTNSVDVTSLKGGIYILQVNNDRFAKFIKQ